MPQEVSIARTIAECTASEYHSLIYEDPTFFKRFHEEENDDPNAVIGPWVDGVRELKYTLPVNLPSTAKRFIGLDAINITEKQSIAWTPDGKAFTVASTPYLDFPGSAKFTTTAQVTVTGRTGECEVVCCLTAAAGLPWPMQSTIEAIMVQQAQVSIGKFLDVCVDHILQQRQQPAAALPAPTEGLAAPPAARIMSPEMQEPEEFWDATDAMSLLSGMGNGEDLHAPGASRFEDPLLVQLRALNASCTQCSKSLEAIAEHLGKISSAASRQQSSLLNSQFLLGLLAASSCAAVVAYVYRHRLSGGGGLLTS